MKRDRHIGHPPGTNASPPAAYSTAAYSTAVCNTLWVIGPVAVAVPVSPVLLLAGAGAEGIGAVWLTAVLFAIGASFVQALWQGIRHGDWSAFTYCDPPGNDDDFDYTARTGRYAFLRNQAEDDALMRDTDRFLQDHDHGDSRP